VILHAGLVALWDGAWRGALIEGDSGAGKSDLALRCLAAGWRLVADDRVVAWRCGDAAYGRAPDSLAGLIEARGIGLVVAPALPFCRIVLRIQLCASDEPIERLPEPAFAPLLQVDLPVVKLASFEASAPVKLAGMMQRLGAGRQQEY
jgi:serine kinase of HPr protein (carbohydrate metabolism regulator)